MPRHAQGVRLRIRKGSPFLWARATLPSGRRWEKSTGVPRAGDRAEATRRAASLYVAALAGDRRPIPASIIDQLDLTQLVSQCLAHETENYAGHDERHVGRIETDLKWYVLRRWDRIEQITEEAWLIARDELHKSRGGPLGSRSIAHLAQTLRHFLRWARDHGFIVAPPEIAAPASKVQRAEKRKKTALDQVQRDRFLRALRELGELRAERIYTALFYSLLRKGELAALTSRWLDRRRREINIPAQHAKSGEPETIDLHPEVARAIRMELKARRKKPGPDEPIFGRFDFHQTNTPKLKGGLFGRACLKAGLVKERPDGTVDFKGLTPHHVTRHSSATIAADRDGTTLHELMALARWRSSAMADRYLHPTVEAGRRALKRL